ncbi:hypothetical protein EMCRGX_G032513 [Ephydatia muelleri]|eukprot:Em0019g194a
MAEQPSLLEDAFNLDEKTLAQVEKIKREISNTCELVGDKDDFCSLEKEYAHDDNIYQAKIQDLKSKYSKLRRTRGDGNCFFRAFAFAYLESLLYNSSDLPRFRDAIVKARESLVALGYPTFTLDDFHDTFVATLDQITPTTTVEALIKTFRDAGTSDYIVCYLRIVTSGYLQTNAEFFQAFVDEGKTIKEYCSEEVEPMYVECDHLHITALTSALGVPVRVQYMDRAEGGQVNQHDFPEGAPPRIHLLYRPGHYDILYQ